MHATDHKCPDQEPGHTPERPEEQRIFLRIMMRGMREISGKPTRRSFVALLACLNNVLSAQVRTRIGDRQNIVCTMAVVTFRRFRVPELGDLAMVRIKVRRRDLLVAAAALCHDLELEPFRVGALDGMGSMAIVTDRQRLVGLADHGNMDAFLELILDPQMAAPARGGDVGRIHTGFRIRHGKFTVRGVTIRACCSHRQAALQQALAVDALRIALDDLMFGPRIPDGGFLPLAMASRTEVRNIRRERR